MVPRWPGGKQGRFQPLPPSQLPRGDNFMHMRYFSYIHNSLQSWSFSTPQGHNFPCLQSIHMWWVYQKNIKFLAYVMSYFISHSSDKSLFNFFLIPDLTRRHSQEATIPFQFLITTQFARNHIKLGKFDNANTPLHINFNLLFDSIFILFSINITICNKNHILKECNKL